MAFRMQCLHGFINCNEKDKQQKKFSYIYESQTRKGPEGEQQVDDKQIK